MSEQRAKALAEFIARQFGWTLYHCATHGVTYRSAESGDHPYAYCPRWVDEVGAPSCQIDQTSPALRSEGGR